MLGHMVSVVSFKQNDSAVSQGGCPVLRPHRQCMSDPAASLAAFGDTTNHLSHPGTCVVCLTLIPRLCLTLRPHRLQLARLLCPWSPPAGKNTGVGCHFLLHLFTFFTTLGLGSALLALCLSWWFQDQEGGVGVPLVSSPSFAPARPSVWVYLCSHPAVSLPSCRFTLKHWVCLSKLRT